MVKSTVKINGSLVVYLLCLVGSTLASGQILDTAMAIPVGGIRQWISMKGTDRRNPVLLILHGGPGNSVISYSDKFTGELQKQFVVVNWDQRESGKTGQLNPSPQPLTVALMTSDAVEVIKYLCKALSASKIYLMGHSWGGFLGMQVAGQHPELLTAYIPICPMIHQAESERLALSWMQTKATAENNQQAKAELSGVHIPFGSGEQLYYHRKWLLHYAGAKEPTRETVESWALKWLALFNEASAINFLATLPRLECPVYFFVGGRDYQTSTKLTTEFYSRVKAPDKQIFVFESTAHNLPTAEPARLQRTILETIVPRVAQK
ncbi:MAG TPA: alpha/beta hydrolase [Chryseolinea sp.]|nr:alpha/beta hydrolase [Chryseolinea sp.]